MTYTMHTFRFAMLLNMSLSAILILFFVYGSNAQAPSMGPYTVDIKGFLPCELREEKPLAKIPWHAEPYFENGTSLIRFNFTIPRNGLSGVRMHGVMSLLRNKTSAKVFSVEGSPCTPDNMLYTLIKAVKIQFNYKDCSPLKGDFQIQGIDIDKTAHSVTKVLPHGTFIVHVWWSISRGIIFCQRMMVESRPLQKIEELPHKHVKP